ncbi:TetR/AcrR family transcriptional regulator [bacterium]|nr:TetR/AcrR family transcriptional regulator [bacterium]MBU1650946.1 TetR/AcrR family transcriptional regulator [bacterium]MBU1881355.1 TetR/AcrR family transcriptional regulator [bacterium]
MLRGKEHLVMTALGLFLRNGYSTVSVNDIVHKAGVSKGAFYHHFKSKQELLELIFDWWLKEDIYKIIDEIVANNATAHEQLQRIFKHSVGRVSTSSDLYINERIGEDLYSLLVLEGISQSYQLKEKVRVAYSDLIRAYEMVLSNGVKSGELKADLDPKMTAINIASQLEGLYTLYVFNRNLNLMEVASRMFGTLWDQIKANSVAKEYD